MKTLLPAFFRKAIASQLLFLSIGFLKVFAQQPDSDNAANSASSSGLLSEAQAWQQNKKQQP